MKEVLDKLCSNYNLSNEDSAFDLLSGVVAFQKSATYVFSKSWIKIETKNGTFSNDCNDGKIDLIDYDVNNSDKTIIFTFVQVQNSESMSSDKIELFVNSVNKYFIEDNDIQENSNYAALIPFQQNIREEIKKYSNYKKKYNICVSYNGKKNQNIYSALDYNINSLKLENVNFEVFHKEKIQKLLIEIRNKVNNPQDVSYNIKSNENYISSEKGNFSSVTMVLSSSEIKKIIDEELKYNIELNRLFNNNVRGFLVKSNVNQQIKETIVKYPDSFYFCNNGATVFCDTIKKNNNKEINIVNPRILNGQQSVASIYLHDKSDKVNINVKFITTDAKEADKMNMQMNLICKTTNTSNPITPINLISNSKLFVSIKKLFENNGVRLKLKQGELLNSVFADCENEIDLEELLKMWATIFLQRPDYAKQYTKIAKIFYKSELEDEKFVIFQDEFVIRKVEKEFLIAYNFFNKIEPILKQFSTFDYYSHAYFFIAFKIYKDYGLKFVIDNIEVEKLTSELEKSIQNYKSKCEDNNKSYSLNNYFKGRKPIIDFGYEIKTESDKLEELITLKQQNIENEIKEEVVV